MEQRNHNPRLGGSSLSSATIFHYYRTGYINSNSNQAWVVLNILSLFNILDVIGV